MEKVLAARAMATIKPTAKTWGRSVALAKVKHLAMQELEALKSLLLAHKIIAIIVAPALLALWSGVGLEIDLIDTHPWAYWSVIMLLAAAQIYFFIPHAELQFATQAYLLVDDAVHERDNLKLTVEMLLSAQANYLAWVVMQRVYLAPGTVMNKARLLEALAEFFRPIIDNLGKLFGMMPGETWSFTIYVHDEDRDCLVAIWRDKSKAHPSPGPTREWRRGVGHVGVTFAKKEPVITPDVSKVDIFRTKAESREYDAAVYRSMAAIPIGSAHVAGDPIGVLVATSDVADRFDIANAYVLRVLASVIGNVILMSNLDRQSLVK